MSYILLRVLREDGEEIKFDRVSKVKWQEKLYSINFIRMLVDAFKTNQNTTKYKKETNLIKDTNSYLTIEWLYVNKLTYAFAVSTREVISKIKFLAVDPGPFTATLARKVMRTKSVAVPSSLSKEPNAITKSLAAASVQLSV